MPPALAADKFSADEKFVGLSDRDARFHARDLAAPWNVGKGESPQAFREAARRSSLERSAPVSDVPLQIMKTFAIGLCLALALARVPARAQETAFTYQGSLVQGAIAANGMFGFQFALFDSASVGTQVGSTLAFPTLTVTNGLFSVALDFGADVFDGSARWLEISVKTNGSTQAATVLAPRQRITAVPYAIRARTATALDGLRSVPTAGTPNLVGGFAGNFFSPDAVGSVIGGGGTALATNQIATSYSVIAGGSANAIATNSASSSIGGGLQNSISTNSRASVIAGGFLNSISFESPASVIGGGTNNNILTYSANAVIGGGGSNTIADASYYSTIGGGLRNWIEVSSDGATIAGGQNNSIKESGRMATISGGLLNSAEDFSAFAVIAGGTENTNRTSASYAAIGGGNRNMISNYANFATIPGGFQNTAAGVGSFAAGSNATAVHNGSFVWSDNTGVDFASSAPNDFSVRATGGIRMITSVNGNGVPTSGVTHDAGSGMWSNLSDRDAKENFQPVNGREILDRVASLPISTWNYKAQSTTQRHIGPTAQDFSAAFRVGGDPRRIGTVDADGVALAAIQGLNELVREQERALRERDARIAAMETSLAELRQRVESLADKSATPAR
jgi:hypothetical protein